MRKFLASALAKFAEAKSLIHKPAVRLALRALLAGLTVFLTQYVHQGIDVNAAIVAAVLAFAEIFTPLNPLVGLFVKLSAKSPNPPAAKA